MAGFIESIPRRRMTACALFLDEAGEFLIVRPTYRADDDWLLVGGAIDPSESPYDACKREVGEELGSDFPVQQLLCIEYQSSSGINCDSLHFIFYGSTLNREQIRQIKLPIEELSEYRFCSLEVAMRLLNSRLAERFVFALKALEQRRVIYLENKVEVACWD
jgi:8-oxo-dGTP diphosphatase